MAYDVTEGEKVQDKEERPKHCTLGDALGQGSGEGDADVDVEELWSPGEISQDRAVSVMLMEVSRWAVSVLCCERKLDWNGSYSTSYRS